MNRTKKSLFVLETITFTKKRRRQKDDINHLRLTYRLFLSINGLKRPKPA